MPEFSLNLIYFYIIFNHIRSHLLAPITQTQIPHSRYLKLKGLQNNNDWIVDIHMIFTRVDTLYCVIFMAFLIESLKKTYTDFRKRPRKLPSFYYFIKIIYIYYLSSPKQMFCNNLYTALLWHPPNQPLCLHHYSRVETINTFSLFMPLANVGN